MSDISSLTEISAPVNNIFQHTMLRRALPMCVYFVGAKGGDVIPSHNDTFTIKWRRYDELSPSTTAISEKTGTISYPVRTGVQASVTDYTATLAKYGQHFVLSEEVDLLNFNGQADELSAVLGEAGGRSLNRLQRNELEDNVTLKYADAGTADGDVASPISLGLVRAAINTLDRNNAMTFTPETTGSRNIGTTPILPSYWLLCHSDVAADAADLKGFKSVETYAGQTETKPGEIGFIGSAGKGVRILSSSEASIDADSGGAVGSVAVRSTGGTAADLYTSVLLGQDAHGAVSLDKELVKEVYKAGDMIPGMILIKNAKGSAGSADPLHEIATIGYKAWHAAEILNANWAVGLRTAASKLE